MLDGLLLVNVQPKLFMTLLNLENSLPQSHLWNPLLAFCLRQIESTMKFTHFIINYIFQMIIALLNFLLNSLLVCLLKNPRFYSAYQTLQYSFSCKTLPNNKSPGPDGIPYDFSKENLRQLMKILIPMYNGMISNSFIITDSGNVITVLFYNLGYRYELKNWRPIAFSNAASKCSQRL